MNRKILILISFFFLFQSATSQNTTEEVIPCFANEMMDQLWNDHPELRENIKQSEIQQAEFRKSFSKTFVKKDDDEYIIPVVFHIIHNNGPENISPAQIENAIENMNLDFAAQAVGINSVRNEFTHLISNTGIKFVLAKRDPWGNCTNGIIRSQSFTTYNGGENLKEVSPAWDRSKYLNIWVCEKIASGAAGYSRYPSSVNSEYGAMIDGIVVRHDYVGAIGTASSSAIHTLTHEAGHWLDLPHTWGSTNQPGLEENCEMDDGVDDTPNTIGWTVCQLDGESCGSLDNVQNFMEYSYCSRMFTHGQGERMIAALNSSIAERNNLWTEENLIATGVLEHESPCAAEFIANKRTICIGEEVTFNDYSYGGINNHTWVFEGGSPVVHNTASPTVTYNSPGLFGVTLAAGNDSSGVSIHKSSFIRVLDTARVATPFSESFENLNSFDNGQSQIWYTESGGNNPQWKITTDAAFSGNKSIRVNSMEAENRAVATIYSQTFDMSAFDSTNATLSLRYAAKRKSADSDDKLRIYITRNCGEHWNMRKELKGDNLYTVQGTQNFPFVPQSEDDWQLLEIKNISPLFFTPEFRIKIELESYKGNNVYIDDINIFNPLTVNVSPVEALKNSVKIYPNPTSGSANVEVEINTDVSQVEVQIFDLYGKLVKEIYAGKLSQGKQNFTIDGSNLSNGLYFVKFTTPAGGFTEKLVIQK